MNRLFYKKILILVLIPFMFIHTKCIEDIPEYGFTNEKIIEFYNFTNNFYEIETIKENKVLDVIVLDTLISKNQVLPGIKKGISIVSADLNNDSTVYNIKNLNTLNKSRIVIYYIFKTEKQYEPENSMRIKIMKINENMPEKLEIDTLLSSYYDFSSYNKNDWFTHVALSIR